MTFPVLQMAAPSAPSEKRPYERKDAGFCPFCVQPIKYIVVSPWRPTFVFGCATCYQRVQGHQEDRYN